MSRLQLALDQIVFAHTYTVRLLDQTDVKDWFRVPTDGVSNIGWQVGHLAMAQYRLCLERIRGTRPSDETLISEAFLKKYGRASVPSADEDGNASPTELRAVYDRVHEQSLRELAELPESELDEPVLKPHALAKTKFWSLLWCAQHEAIHAGQIGLLRRQVGHAPLW